MLLRRLLARFALFAVALSLAACGANGVPPTPTLLPFASPGPLTATANFWDMGLSINYPTTWAEPQLIAGQMTLGPTPGGSAINQVVIALRIVNSPQDLNVPQDASLAQIATALTGGGNVALTNSRATNLAFLETVAVDLEDKDHNLYGIIYVFRLPDSRLGAMIAIAPRDLYADYFPTIESMRGSAKILKPAEFTPPGALTDKADFPSGGISFTLPTHWVSHDLNGARIFHDSAAAEYLDQSGFVSGAQLVVVGQPIKKFTSVRDLIAHSISPQKGDVISDVSVGGQHAVQIASTDKTTGQNVTFIAVPSQDRRTLIVFRWTVPGMLINVTRPTLDAIMQSVRFEPVQF